MFYSIFKAVNPSVSNHIRWHQSRFILFIFITRPARVGQLVTIEDLEGIIATFTSTNIALTEQMVNLANLVKNANNNGN